MIFWNSNSRIIKKKISLLVILKDNDKMLIMTYAFLNAYHNLHIYFLINILSLDCKCIHSSLSMVAVTFFNIIAYFCSEVYRWQSLSCFFPCQPNIPKWIKFMIYFKDLFSRCLRYIRWFGWFLSCLDYKESS